MKAQYGRSMGAITAAAQAPGRGQLTPEQQAAIQGLIVLGHVVSERG